MKWLMFPGVAMWMSLNSLLLAQSVAPSESPPDAAVAPSTGGVSVAAEAIRPEANTDAAAAARAGTGVGLTATPRARTGAGDGSVDSIDVVGGAGEAESLPTEPPAKKKAELISITLDNVSVMDVIRMFTRISGANIIASATNLEGTVTVSLTDVEWKPALSSILEMHNLALVEKTPGSEVYSVVHRPADAPPPVFMETIFLKYTTVAEVMPVIRNVVTSNATVSTFPSRNAIVIKTTEANLVEIRKLLEAIDIQCKQVCIETKFMELNDQASKQLGIKWSSLEEVAMKLSAPDHFFQRSENMSRVRGRDDRLWQWDRRVSDDRVVEYYDVNDYQIENQNKITITDEGAPTSPVRQEQMPATAKRTVSSEGLIEPTRTIMNSTSLGKEYTSDVIDAFRKTITDQRAAILDIEPFRMVLSALKVTDGVSVISNPKLITASGSTNAFFSVGTREPIIKTTIERGTQDSPGDTIITELDTSINTEYIKQGYLNTGIELRVIPFVKTEELIETEIIPSLRTPLEPKEVGGNKWPVISVKEIRTRFTLQSGQTVAISGLTGTEDAKTVTKIPLLGDIPIVGKYLFSHTKDVKRQSETIIFVTLSLADPQIIRRDAGIPEESELVHKRLMQSDARRKQFRDDLDTATKATDTRQSEETQRTKSRLLRRRD